MKTLIALLLVALSVPAFAGMNARYLQTACSEYEKAESDPSRDQYKAGVCYGYMQGWGYSKALEEGATGHQLARVFLKYMADHPEQENKKVGAVFTQAMVEAGLTKP